jgi:phosphopantetheinyl transferase
MKFQDEVPRKLSLTLNIPKRKLCAMCPTPPSPAPVDVLPAADYHWGEPLTTNQSGRRSLFPALAESEVHLWWLDLTQAESDATGGAPSEKRGSSSETRHWLDDLNDEERQRALRYRRRRDGDRFASVRRALRRLLARYLNVAPLEVELELGPNGKPQLSGPLAHTGLQFNVSHSGDQALLGFRYHAPLGVDLEQERAEVDFDGVARLMFSPSEVDWLGSDNATSKGRPFYQIWSRKEAILKCVGWGLGGPRPTSSWSVVGRSLSHWPRAELQVIPGFDTSRPRLLLVDLPEALATTPAPFGMPSEMTFGMASEMASGQRPLAGYAASVAAWCEPAASSICLRWGDYSVFSSVFSSAFFAPGL